MSMGQLRAQELVVGCLAGSLVVAAGSTVAQGHVPGISLMVGTAFVGLGLSVAAMFDPGLAAGFAVLLLVSTTTVYGKPLFDAVAKVTGTTPAPAQRKAAK